MMRVVNGVEKNVYPDPCLVIPIAVGVSVKVLSSVREKVNVEYAGRYIQNVGLNPCFYAFGQDCDSVGSYNGILAASQQLDCSNHSAHVSVWSQLGTTIATTVLRRNDMVAQENIGRGNMNMP